MKEALSKQQEKHARRRAWKRLQHPTTTGDILLELLSIGYATYRGVSRWPLTTISREENRALWDLYRDYVRQEQQAIHRLHHRKLVEARKTAQGLEVLLTDAGQVEALRWAILTETSTLPEGQRCYVSFDIPELSRNQRNEFRRLLRKVGFQLVHQSLWRSRKDVGRLLGQLVVSSKLEKAIFVFVGQD